MMAALLSPQPWPLLVGKYNPYHRGPGPGGGQFTTADQDGQSASGCDVDQSPKPTPDAGSAGVQVAQNVPVPAGAGAVPISPANPAYSRGHSFSAKDIDLLPKNIKDAFIALGYDKLIGTWIGKTHQCVALVKDIAPEVGHASAWVAGEKVQDTPNLKPGSPVATFNFLYDGQRHYGPRRDAGGVPGQSHSGIYLGKDSDGIYLFNQFSGSKDASVITYFPWDAAWGIHGGSEIGSKYYRILIRNQDK